MKYSTKTGKLDETTHGLSDRHGEHARDPSRARSGLDDYFEASSHDFVDKPGRTLLIALPKSSSIRRLLLVGIGDADELPPGDFRKIIGAVGSVLKAAAIKDAMLAIDAFKVAGYDGYQKARVALALLTAQLYRFAASKQQEDPPAAQIGRLTVALRNAQPHRDRRAPCSTRRRSTREWRSRAIWAISRRTSAIRPISPREAKKLRARDAIASA